LQCVSSVLSCSVRFGQLSVLVSGDTAAFTGATIPLTLQLNSAVITVQVPFCSTREIRVDASPLPAYANSDAAYIRGQPVDLARVGSTEVWQRAALRSYVVIQNQTEFDVTAETVFRVNNATTAPFTQAPFAAVSNGVIHHVVPAPVSSTQSAPATSGPATVIGDWRFGAVSSSSSPLTVIFVTRRRSVVQITLTYAPQLVGLVGYQASPLTAGVTLDDGTMLPNAPTQAPGLLLFSSTSAAIAVDSTSGVVTLNGNAPQAVAVQASASGITSSALLVCNLEVGAGDVDIGRETGVALQAAAPGTTFTAEVRVGLVNGDSLTAFNLRITTGAGVTVTGVALGSGLVAHNVGSMMAAFVADPTQASIGGLLTASTSTGAVSASVQCAAARCAVVVATVTFTIDSATAHGATIAIGGVLEELHVAGPTASVTSPGRPFVAGAVSVIVDSQRLGRLRRADAPAHMSLHNRIAVHRRQTGGTCPYGDVNGDCATNLVDAALILTRVNSNGVEPISWDLNRNGVVDYGDAHFVVGLMFGIYPRPPTVGYDGYATSATCQFDMSARVQDAAGADILTAQVFFLVENVTAAQIDPTLLVGTSFSGNSFPGLVWEASRQGSAYHVTGELLSTEYLHFGISVAVSLRNPAPVGFPALVFNQQATSYLNLPTLSIGGTSGPVQLTIAPGHQPALLVNHTYLHTHCAAGEQRCPSTPCMNGATCVGAGVCSCVPGFHGLLCEVVDTTTTATATTVTATTTTATATVVTSTSSVTLGSACAQPCRNGGVCVDATGVCSCPAVFNTVADCSVHICDHIVRFCNTGACNRNATVSDLVCTCPAGTVGARCDVALASPASDSGSSSNSAIMVPVVIVATLVMLGVLVLVYASRRNGKKGSGTAVVSGVAPINWDGIDEVGASHTVLPHIANTSFAGDVVARTASAEAQLAFLTAKFATADADFDRIDKEKQSATYRATHDGANSGKNRYLNVKAYDDTRVRIVDAEGSDYINANHVTATIGTQQLWYIASQGPLRSTFDDFWAMVWQQRSKLIAMVTGLEEGGRIKCDRYWPEVDGQETIYGGYGVTVDRSRNLATYTVTCFKVRCIATGEQRAVWHLHYTAWPDFGVPTDQGMLAYLGEIRAVRSALGEMDVPIIAHCSAGIGRTGVLIMLEIALAKLESGDLPDLELQLEELREQRAGLVQTAEQFRFCYSCLMGAMQFSANTNGMSSA
jgi:protein tyrosine phosphatase